MSIISEMLKHNISFHFKYGCWTRRKKQTSQRYPLSFFFLCHAIFMTALIMKQSVQKLANSNKAIMVQRSSIRWHLWKLTKTEKHHRHFSQRCVWGRKIEFSFRPSQPVLVEPRQDVVSAQRLRLGHQLLLGQWSVKHIQDLCSKHWRPAQDLHVLMQGEGDL